VGRRTKGRISRTIGALFLLSIDPSVDSIKIDLILNFVMENNKFDCKD